MKKYFFCVLTIALFFSCEKKDTAENKIFKRLDHTTTGISFSNILTENDSLNYFSYAYIYMGGGVAAGDINNDGLVDLFFTGNMVSNKLYLNKGGLKFEDISEKAGLLGDDKWYTGVTMADVNNDGFLDIYCSVAGKFGSKENLLYINNGDLTFSEKAKEYGIADAGNSVQATFFDYDLDGDLDLYVANYPPTNFNAPNTYYRFKMAHVKETETDHLYRNDGTTFTDVTHQAGLLSFGLTLSATVGDVNNDGWPDIYISNDFSTPDYLFLNNKNGTFSDQVKKSTKQTAFYGMGVDIADFNNDLLLDVIQVDMMAQNNRRAKANMASMNPDLFWSTVNSGFHYQYMQNNLQLNNGLLTNDSIPDFSNVARLAGLSSTDWSWGPLFADLDNDGWKDIFISNGTRREINNRDFFKKIEKKRIHKDSFLIKALEIPSEKIDNFVFKNNRDLTFDHVNKEWGLQHKGFSNGCVYVDLDNDGDLEIITNNIDDYATVFENRSSQENNHLTLKFKGPEKNKFGLGVKVTMKSGNISQFQEMTLTRGFQSSVAPQLHFGIGKEEIVDSLKVKWPDGKVQLMANIEVNQFLEINYQEATLNSNKIFTENSKLFSTEKDSLVVANHKHVENFYNDFVNEVLLPHRTSTFGPGISVGDLNGDGLDDFVVSGAAKSPTAIYFQTTSGFEQQQLEAVASDSEHEDLGSLIFDADNDGDNDLYIVSGGNEFEPDSPYLQDRLYINDGNQNFIKSTALPKMITSGSRVSTSDFDQDGDLDLFVGGRLVPGNYPSPASSYILENQSENGQAKFVDVTDQIAPELRNIGMVTEGLWTDYNGDGSLDLIVVGEWMPITIFENSNGSFTNVTEQRKLSDSNGWWFSIKEGDFDGDGDLDYIVGNLGLNYKYKANEKEPFDIYFNDFDKNNKGDIVLSYYNEGEKFPVRGRECSSQQIPAIKSKYQNYESFSNATLVDIYTENDLEKSLHYEVKSFASIYLENKDGQFISHNLPNLAQISNINQILVKDFDGDTHLDALIAGNLHGSEVETPRNDASNGLLLKGDGQGNFIPVRGKDSGLYTTGDVKDLATISIAGKKYIIAAKNNDYLQFISTQ